MKKTGIRVCLGLNDFSALVMKSGVSHILRKSLVRFRSKHTLSLAMALALTLLGTSCRQEEDKKVDRAQCDALYGELLATYKAYADSLNRLAPGDTTGHALAVTERFERRIKDIYWRYPMDLDQHLSETQNDTLWHYAKAYMDARQRHMRVERPDTASLAPDSLPATPAL